MEYCTVEKKYKSVEETSEQNYFNYLKLQKSGLSSDSHIECSKVITVRRTRRNLYTAIVENFGKKMAKSETLKTFRKPGKKKLLFNKRENLEEKSGFNSTNNQLTYETCDKEETKRLQSDIAVYRSNIPDTEAMKKVEFSFMGEKNVPLKKRKGLKWCSNRDNAEVYNHCLDSPKPLVIDETEFASQRNEELIENYAGKCDNTPIIRENQKKVNIEYRIENDVTFENIEQTSDKLKKCEFVINPLDQGKWKNFDERLFFDDVHKILTIHTMQVSNRSNDVTEEVPVYFKDNEVGNEVTIENVELTDHIKCSESTPENVSEIISCSENDRASNSTNTVPSEILSHVINDHSLYSKAANSRPLSSSEYDQVQPNKTHIEAESRSLHFAGDNPSELRSCPSNLSNEVLVAPAEFELLPPDPMEDVGFISYTPNYGDILLELTACLKGIEAGKPVADFISRDKSVDILSSLKNDECDKLSKRAGIGNIGLNNEVQDGCQDCRELYKSSHEDEIFRDDGENSHSIDATGNEERNKTQHELEESIEISKNDKDKKNDEDKISQIPSSKKGHTNDETVIIPTKKIRITLNSDEDNHITNETVQNNTSKENDKILENPYKCKTVRKSPEKHNDDPNKNSLRIRKECQMFNFSGRNLLNPSKIFHTPPDVVPLPDLLTRPVSRLDESSDVPNVIRIEKSPPKLINNGEPLRNDIFSKFSASRNLSKFVQKEEDSNDESVWDGDVKADVKVEPEPMEIEVVHYKKDRIPNNLSPLSKPKRKYCPFCNVGYTNEVALGRHLTRCKMHPKNLKDDPTKVFLCKFCNLGITDEVYFKQHEEKCQKEFLYKQNSRIFPTLDESVMNSFIKEKQRYSCPNCDYTSKNVGHMKVHRRIHSKVFLCICDVCQKGFNRLDALQIHMFRHIDVAENVEELEKVKVQNDNAYKSTLSVIINKKTYKVYKYACVKCSYVTPVGESMDKHFKTMHLSTPKFHCNICGFSTKLKSNLKQHLNRHLRVKTHKCSFCPYETVSTSYIRKHENQVHLKKVVTKCEVCDFSTYHKDNLKIHMNSAHIKSVKYSCDKCSYSSYMNSNLINHVKSVHEGKKRRKKQKK